ncbi:phytosulfokine 4 precursor [Hibiscus trionum]|uniref:Phytosulfokine n=1 Tax=Hibiscus trionum TaxID=183268 RepID=A0A9W7J4R0_HIBTR|nr:phytosulfokine 4 precursor [Hibiscus trionum]
MAKLATFLLLTLLLVSTLSFAARSGPALPSHSTANTQVQGIADEDNCNGIGEEECLMRRTLAAHIDYIYTQKHKP